jgi:hypothetical protein
LVEKAATENFHAFTADSEIRHVVASYEIEIVEGCCIVVDASVGAVVVVAVAGESFVLAVGDVVDTLVGIVVVAVNSDTADSVVVGFVVAVFVVSVVAVESAVVEADVAADTVVGTVVVAVYAVVVGTAGYSAVAADWYASFAEISGSVFDNFAGFYPAAVVHAVTVGESAAHVVAVEAVVSTEFVAS